MKNHHQFHKSSSFLSLEQMKKAPSLLEKKLGASRQLTLGFKD